MMEVDEEDIGEWTIWGEMEDLYTDVGSAVVYMLSNCLKLSELPDGYISCILHPVVTNANGRPCRSLRPHVRLGFRTTHLYK